PFPLLSASPLLWGWKPTVHGRSLSQLPGFTLTVPQSVSVQEGLCVLIPCTFTYSASSNTYSSWPQLYRYWYKDQASVVWNPPVASSESSREVSQETRGRFQLAKNPAHGDCSLQISDARRTDAGKYFFRFKKGTLMYNYLSNSYVILSSPHVSELTEEPEIQISPADGLPGTLLAGEPVTVTCTAPGRCSGPPPRVTWTGPFRNTAQDVSTQLANGSWAYSSALSFTPGPGDHGKELVCTISYRPPWGPSTRRTVQLHVVWPAPLGTEGDVVSLETQEDDSLSLSCDAGSRPEATLSWARMNRSLSPGQEGTRRLELPNLRIGDAGEYRCWAKNSYGSASRALRVHVQSKALGGAVLQGSGQGFSEGRCAAGGWVGGSAGGTRLQGVGRGSMGVCGGAGGIGGAGQQIRVSVGGSLQSNTLPWVFQLWRGLCKSPSPELTGATPSYSKVSLGVGSGAWGLSPLEGAGHHPASRAGTCWLRVQVARCYFYSQIPAPWWRTGHSFRPGRATPCGSSAPSPAAPPLRWAG
uniref:Ig-like domain-containing protein n=1 Tax=Chelonoidis abingdonii TaxID=106734 RepID=A0A8C0IKL0_CHEAB